MAKGAVAVMEGMGTSCEVSGEEYFPLQKHENGKRKAKASAVAKQARRQKHYTRNGLKASDASKSETVAVKEM